MVTLNSNIPQIFPQTQSRNLILRIIIGYKIIEEYGQQKSRASSFR